MNKPLLDWIEKELNHLQYAVLYKSDENNIQYMRGRIDALKEIKLRINLSSEGIIKEHDQTPEA